MYILGIGASHAEAVKAVFGKEVAPSTHLYYWTFYKRPSLAQVKAFVSCRRAGEVVLVLGCSPFKARDLRALGARVYLTAWRQDQEDHIRALRSKAEIENGHRFDRTPPPSAKKNVDKKSVWQSWQPAKKEKASG